MGCVNKSSREFKNAVTRNNVSDNILELIVHKYWMVTGNEESFPSDMYIQAQLGNTQYQEQIKEIRKLWDLKYGISQTYDTLEEVQEASREASEYFPSDAIVYYKNAENKFILSVKQPVEKLPETAGDFFSQDFTQAKTLDLGLNEEETYDMDKVKELFDRFNTDRASRYLADKVFSLTKDLGIKVVFNNDLPSGKIGRTINNGTIIYTKSFFEKDINNEKKASLLLHEAIHALTMYALSDSTESRNINEDLGKFRTDINQIFNEVRLNKVLEGERGIHDVNEFVAELSNPIFRQKLQSIDTDKPQSIWSQIVNAIKSLLGLHTSNTYYQRSMNALEKALNAFDLDSWLAYNGVKSQLRQAYNEHRVDFENMSEDELRSMLKTAIKENSEGKDETTGQQYLISYIDNLSKEQIVDELKKIKQEYADYDIVNSKAENTKERKTGKSTFTFSDGITVETPFHLNSQQKEALNVMNDFVSSFSNSSVNAHSNDNTTMTLSGYAGTGKTSLLGILAKKVHDPNKIAFSATTNKATKVLRAKLPKGSKVMTANQIFGINMEINQNSQYNMNDLVVSLKEAKIDPGTVVVIDEASMVSERNYKLLNEIAEENGLKIIYVGDKGQLAPIGDTKISPVFRNANGKVVELTKVERTDDNAILKEATDIRNGKSLSMESSFNDEGKGVAYVNPKSEHRQYIVDTIKHFIPGLKSNGDYFKVLAFTNETVSQYNEYIRKLLGYSGYIPEVGETLVGYANWGRFYDRRLKKAGYSFINSEIYKVTKVGSQESSHVRARNVYVTMEATPITLVDSLGNKVTVKLVDIKGNSKNREAATKLAQVKAAIHEDLRRARSRKEKAIFLQEENSIDRELFVNDNIYATDKDGKVIVDSKNKPVLLQKKVFDFGYALTVHKSQGSTFNNVLIDENDIEKADINSAMGDRLVSVEDVNFDFEEPASVSDQSDMVNMKQQLEYVAISRASDTVTVITDKTKKEDSVLNHIKDSSNTAEERQQATPSENTTSQPANTPSVTQQLVDHIQNTLGIKLMTDNEAKEYLSQHGIDVQAARPIDNYHNSTKASKKVIGEILDIVKGNKYNKVGTDAVTLSSENNKYIYLIDHPSDAELPDNLKTGDGFGIRKKYEVNKLTKEDIYEITRNIAPQYNYSEESIRRVLSRLGVKSADMLGINIADAIKRGADDNAVGYGRAGEDGSQLGNNRGSLNGREDTQEISFFKTSKGVIYGFVTKDGRMYLNTKIITPEHPIHEYTHLWDNVVQKRNPTLWKRGVKLMQRFNNSELWNEIARSEQYGKRWQQQGLRGEELINRIASEVHARLVGENGAKLLDEIAKKKGQEGIVAKLKEWILEVWKDLKATFSNWSDDDIKRLTLKDFNHMTVRDFADAVKFNEIPSPQTAQSEVPAQSVTSQILEHLKDHHIEVSGIDPADTTISPEHPIHEYTRLWDKVVEEKNPNLWKRGVELMKQFDGGRMWNEYSESEQYGKKWKTSGLPDSQIENLIASEIHARLVGTSGEKLLDTIAKEKRQEGIVAKLKAWIKEFWQNLKATFSRWSPEDIRRLSISEFNHMTIRDFADGIDFDTAPAFESTAQTQSPEQQTLHAKQHEMITVKLPEYEAFNNLIEPVTTERWKEGRLKELEDNLHNADTPQEKQEIADKIDDVLKAKTSADLDSEYSSKRKERTQKQLDNYNKINKQVRNLYEGKFAADGEVGDGKELDMEKDLGVRFTASEINKVSEYVADYLSDLITSIQTGKAKVKDLFPDLSLSEDINFAGMSRTDIVKTIGIGNIIDKVKNDFNPESEVISYDDGDTILKAGLMVENWDAIMLNASKFLSLTEGFGVSMDYDEGKLKMADADLQVDPDNTTEDQDEASIEETEGDAQEHWQVEADTLSTISLMTDLVKQTMRNMYQLDSEGKIMNDPDWMLPMRVPLDKSTKNILSWIQGAMSLQEMIDKIEEKKDSNPWVSQLLDLLKDKSGQFTDFQSQFYGTFSKTFKLYSITAKDKDSVYTSIPVNSHPGLKTVLNDIIARYHMNEYPLINSQGKINIEYLGSESTSNSDEYTLNNISKTMYKLREDVRRRLCNQNKFRKGDQRIYSLTQEETDEAVKLMTGAYRLLGYYVEEDAVRSIMNTDNLDLLAIKLQYTAKDLTEAYERQRKNPKEIYEPFIFKGRNSIASELSALLEVVMGETEANTENVVYDSGKLYQSYVIPSFITRLVQNLTRPYKEKQAFMDEEYGRSEWFRLPDGTWRNKMLKSLYKGGGGVEYYGGIGLMFAGNSEGVFDFKTELNFNKHNYMKSMSPAEYTLSLFTNYFAEGWKTKTDDISWYRMPMPSNKPASEFFRWYSYREESYKEHITDDLYDFFLQELSRIQTVRMRNLSKGDKGFIDNFDTNGREFCFLPFLNSYLENTEGAIKGRTLLKNEDGTPSEANSRLATLLQKKIKGTEEDKLSSEEEVELMNHVKEAIYNYMETRANQILDAWNKKGILEAARKVKNIVWDNSLLDDDDHSENRNKQVRKSLENYIWNDYLANKNILELVVGDLAFAKNTDDLIKRLSGFHAPGIRGNKNATDYRGNKVSDGKHRTLILKDWDNFVSNIIDNIAEVYDRKIERAKDHEKEALKAIKENLVGENGKYRNINVADAQGLMSPSSMRKKAFIFGKMIPEAENAYQDYKKGKYKPDSLIKPFQTWKPFVYTHVLKNMGTEGSPISMMYTPFMAKNSEYMLVMADALIKEEELVSGEMSRPNLLRAVFRVMEESYNADPTKGIDTVQFESAIKLGKQGAIDIHQFADMEGGEEAAYTYLKEHMYLKNEDGTYSNNYDTDNYVQEHSYDDYAVQQEIPAHFKDHSQIHASQERVNVIADLDYYKDPYGDLEDPANIVRYEWTEPDGKKESMTATEFQNAYEQTIADNIQEDIDRLYAEFHLEGDKKEKNIALSRVLQEEIMSSPRYGMDLFIACSVDEETGEFRMPKGDPIQAKRIEQLINSIIKSRINKQKIAGGPIVQVTNYGTSKRLNIRFKDKDGNILMTKDEFEKAKNSGKDTGYESYKEYIKNKQDGIAYFEVYAPIWNDKIIEYFADEDGDIDMDAIEKCDPDLLKLITYRIPNEDKYSVAPCKIVGFMPREAGDAIMLPYDLTTIDDSDFDIDKRYTILKQLDITRKPRKQLREMLWKDLKENYDETHEGKMSYALKQKLNEEINMVLDNPHKMMASGNALDAYMSALIRENGYTVKKPTEGRLYRDNRIVDMTWAALTNGMTADKLLNPGGFDEIKKLGYLINTYRNSSDGNRTWNELAGKSTDELKGMNTANKDLGFPDVQIQYYRQNSATSGLIGVFAVNKSAHAILERDKYRIDIEEACGKGFKIAGREYTGRMIIDDTRDTDGKYIGKTLGSGVSASADGVKEPVLTLMNIYMSTAGLFNVMLRLGIPLRTATLLMSQDVMTKTLESYEISSLSNYVTLNTVIGEYVKHYMEFNHIESGDAIFKEDITENDLIEGLREGNHDSLDFKVMNVMNKMLQLNTYIRRLTYATRFNSISNAVGPLIINNLIQKYKMNQFKASDTKNNTTGIYDKDGNPVDINTVFKAHPMLDKFSQGVTASDRFFNDMPAGSRKFEEITNAIKGNLKDKIVTDERLLSNLSDFYQTYVLVASGLANPSELKYYIEEFPAEFIKNGYKEKYMDNALLQAIKPNVNRKTNRTFLSINITGMGNLETEKLKNAWEDLHRQDPKLSEQLFWYNYFRGGIGFNPKTFMSLVPTYVKEHLSRTLDDGNVITYVDSYRTLPDADPGAVFRQFVRNNWTDNKLVPRVKIGKKGFMVDYIRGKLVITDNASIERLKDTPYIKTKDSKKDNLWEMVTSNSDELVFNRIEPFGNNGEYIEMSKTDVKKVLNKTDNAETTDTEKGMRASETDSVTDEVRDNGEYNVDNLLWLIEMEDPTLTGENGLKRYEDIKKAPEQYGSFLANVFEKKGIHVDKDAAIKEFKKYC